MTLRRAKVYGVVLGALVVVAAFLRVNGMVRQQTLSRLLLQQALAEVIRLDEALVDEILRSAFFLYHDYDRIHIAQRRLEAGLASLVARHREVNGAGGHTTAKRLLGRYQAQMERRRLLIQRFLTANATVKNASAYIPVLLRRAIEVTDVRDPAYLDRLSAIASLVFRIRSGLDVKLLADLRQAMAALSPPHTASAQAKAIHQAFLGHLRIFVEAFPRYTDILAALLRPDRLAPLRDLRQHYAEEDQGRMFFWGAVSYVFLAAFLGAIFLVVFLLLRVERERVRLEELQEALAAAASTDPLTGLANRFAFDRDEKHYQHPLLFLLNLDAFQQINNLYGVHTGDRLLCAVAERLRRFAASQPEARCYRLGGDEFGMLVEPSSGYQPEQVAQGLIELVERQPFDCSGQLIAVSLSVGVSGQRPLLETADMALKRIKRSRRSKYLVYSDDLDTQQVVAANLAILSAVRHAIEHNGVLVYFQPIVDNRTGAVVKYECLMRLRDPQGNILAPARFLDVARGSAYYPALTRAVISRCFAAFQECDCGLSVNLTVTDILDPGVHEFISAKLLEFPALARRLTFEILESEGVDDYETVACFVSHLKECGCSVAVDDFGAGYANFAHVLRLGVDTVKIDASLIKQVDTDPDAEVLVRAVVAFCRELGITTVAEFVHSAAVHRKVCALGIDYSQGYFIGKPLPTLPQQLVFRPCFPAA